MGIGPLLPGRLPNSLASRRLTTALQDINQQIARLQDQAATGQRYFLPSEEPTSAIRTIALQRALERQEHYKSSIANDQDFLNATEATLADVGTAANRAKALVLAGIGSSTSADEKEALAVEAESLLRSVFNAANTQNRGRYIYSGSDSQVQPFEIVGDGVVRYNGDKASIQSYVGNNLTIGTNIDGATAFNALSTPVTRDVNPALTLSTKVSDLLSGRGISLGRIQLTVDDGVNPATTQIVDLTGAETIGDIQTRLQAAFPPGALTVGINGTNNGLSLSAAGSVSVSDVSGSRVAIDLGISGGPAATITGSDLDPRLTLQTRLADFNGGAGIANATNHIVITNGSKSASVDISGAQTVEDLYNLLEQQDLDLYLDINDAGNGLAISTRLSGVDFSIGEEGGTTAQDLGIRTFTGSTLLSDLNRGTGVPVGAASTLNMKLNDGTTLQISMTGARTVQDVIDRINGAGNANLSASLNANGNGIAVQDTSAGAGGFSMSGEAAIALGLDQSIAGNGTIAGRDVNPQEAEGILNVLLTLTKALRGQDDRTLNRLDGVIDDQIAHTNVLRGNVGSRLRFLDDVNNRIEDQNIAIQEQLSTEFGADLTEVITQLTSTQAGLQATLQIASQTLQLSLFNYL